MGNCPFFLSLSHNTASCIVTQGLTGPRRKAWARKGVQWHATTRRGKAGTRPCDTARKGHDTVGQRGRACGSAPMFAAWLVGESRYKHCIMARGRPCVVTQCATRLRYGAQRPATRRRGAVTRSVARATRRAAGARVAIQFCIVTEGRDIVLRHGSHAHSDTAGLGHDTAGVGAMMRPN